MRLIAFIAQRVTLLLLVLVVVSMLVFGIVQILPGDVATEILGTEATPANLAALRQRLGLAQPAALRYRNWISGALRGDWGTSLLYQIPVRGLVLERLKHSAVLAVLAFGIAVPLAIFLGTIAALFRNRFLDHLISIGCLFAVSLPEFVWGSLLIVVLAYRYHIAPPSSLIDPRASLLSQESKLVLPIVTLILVLLAQMVRMVRASMIEALEKPFIRAARLRGLRPRRVILAHALRNALLPTVGVIALNVGFLVGGIVVVETVFAYPGLGRLLVEAVNNRDVTVLQMAALIVAMTYALANLAADITYAYLDPRIRY